MFDELRQAVKSIECLSDPNAGEVRFGSTILLAGSFIYAVIAGLSRRYPRMRFDLVTAQQDALQRQFIERDVDLLIAWERGSNADERLNFEFLYDDSYVVVAGAQSPWARRRRIELAELVSESWTLPPPQTVLGMAVLEAFRASGLDGPRATVTVLPGDVRLKLLGTGRFLTIFQASALRLSDERPQFKVLPVKLPFVPRPSESLRSRTARSAQLRNSSSSTPAKLLSRWRKKIVVARSASGPKRNQPLAPMSASDPGRAKTFGGARRHDRCE